MNILFVGDIVGAPGRQAIISLLPELRQTYDLDLVIANGENATHGHGISPEHYDALVESGVDWLTSGDHIWKRPQIFAELDGEETRLLRPANYPKGVPGLGVVTFSHGPTTISLINLIGRVFMHEGPDNPFHAFDEIERTLPKSDVILVDFHAEATSEKWCLGHYLDGRVTAVLGTHTHVPTADERILPKGTAFISDVGMTGPLDSSIGTEKQPVIDHFLTGLPWRYEVAAGPVWFNAILLQIQKGRATKIERVQRFLP